MLSWIIKIIIISVIFIFLVHHLICFFKDTLTIPKTKDIIGTSSKKYEEIYSALNHNSNRNSKYNHSSKYNDMENDKIDGTYIDLLPIRNSDTDDKYSEFSMKDELKNFLKDQMNDESFF